MDQTEFNVTTIQNFLEAYFPSDVKKAVSNWAKVRVSRRLQTKEMFRTQVGWTKYEGDIQNIPKGYDWQKHGDEIWVKSSQPITQSSENTVSKKQDLTPVVSDLKCPICGEMTVKEPICKGCKEGHAGFTFRHICMDNMDHVFYIKSVEEIVEG